MSGSSIARLITGGTLIAFGLLSGSRLIDGAYQRRAKAFQIASSVCSSSEKLVPISWWQKFTSTSEDSETPVLLEGQSKWSIGVPIFITVLAIELCDSFLTMWNTFSVVAQTSSLFITYSSTAFALMTVRSLYLVMVGQNTAIEPRLKHTNLASGLVLLTVGCQLLMSRFGTEPPIVWPAMIGLIGLGLTAINVVDSLRRRH